MRQRENDWAFPTREALHKSRIKYIQYDRVDNRAMYKWDKDWVYPTRETQHKFKIKYTYYDRAGNTVKYKKQAYRFSVVFVLDDLSVIEEDWFFERSTRVGGG